MYAWACARADPLLGRVVLICQTLSFLREASPSSFRGAGPLVYTHCGVCSPVQPHFTPICVISNEWPSLRQAAVPWAASGSSFARLDVAPGLRHGRREYLDEQMVFKHHKMDRGTVPGGA